MHVDNITDAAYFHFLLLRDDDDKAVCIHSLDCRDFIVLQIVENLRSNVIVVHF